MANIFYVSDMYHPSGLRTVPIYNVSEPVGAGGRNRMDDTVLVQFFLHKVGNSYLHMKHPSLANLAMDGICGPKTLAAIDLYQQVSPARLHRDGVVDSAGFAKGIVSSLSHTEYTIVALNMEYSYLFRSIWPDIKKDPRCPLLLYMNPDLDLKPET